jgi:site-specific recombinase XerD
MENKYTINIEQIISAELLNWMEAFLISGQTTGLSKNTIQFYKEGLQSFMRFCSQIEVDSIYDVTAIEIRKYLLHLENTGHNPGGV